MLVVATTDAFAGSLETIREALDVGLLTPLEKRGPRVQIAVIGYGNTTDGQKRTVVPRLSLVPVGVSGETGSPRRYSWV